jgi:hypothetical protein
VGAGALTTNGPLCRHSPPTRVPFSATERFITKTTGTSKSITIANTQKQRRVKVTDRRTAVDFAKALED